ncbi:MAG: glycoside hydrolase family 2 [Erysipelotrichaceae bacterium]|nr:glycoside hydrolase family 2 [Erysipelotrichaceae bacterium]
MYRQEYPRPQFVREDWINLNGSWQFEFDDANAGLDEAWMKGHEFSKTIEVPFAYQTELSGICDTSAHDVIWYQRLLDIPENWKDKRVLLHFGAVDYRCEVYVNGKLCGTHEGGHTSFEFDITRFLSDCENVLTLRVEDPSFDESIPRGKQTWHKEPFGIWYTRTSGIWQTVWMEAVDHAHLASVKMSSDLDTMSELFEFKVTDACIGKHLELTISFQGEELVSDSMKIYKKEFVRSVNLIHNEIYHHGVHGAKHGWMWSPEVPNLFDVTFRIVDDSQILDEVNSYFGMRKIHTQNGMVFLNNKPYYQKLVLNQGYWRKGLLTAEKDEDFIKDIELMKSMGFNGCRIHQKVEDPRFLYWADHLGFLVWGECAAFPSWHTDASKRLMKEWFEIIERDFNHPSIITWTPINESWGVEDILFSSVQQNYALALYYMIKSMDPTRLVVSNDGWECVKSDIVGVHNYRHGQAYETGKYADFIKNLKTAEGLTTQLTAGRMVFANGFGHEGQPILLTEFGGIAYDSVHEKGWGYTSVTTEEEFLQDYQRIMEAIYASETLHGFCYTQLSDVQQEINGLLNFDHEPKVEVSKIKEINDMWHSLTIKQ